MNGEKIGGILKKKKRTSSKRVSWGKLNVRVMGLFKKNS